MRLPAQPGLRVDLNGIVAVASLLIYDGPAQTFIVTCNGGLHVRTFMKIVQGAVEDPRFQATLDTCKHRPSAVTR